MKNKNFLLFLLLLSLDIIFCGCSDRYKAERKFWFINKKYSNIIKNPQKADEKKFQNLIKELKFIVDKYPNWENSSKIQFLVGDMFLMRKNFDEAEKEFMKVVINFPKDPEVCSRALFAVGNIREKQNQWEKALEKYEELINNYFGTFIGLQMPLYIARYYRSKNLLQKSKDAYARAIIEYINAIETNPYSKRVPILQDLLMMCYYENDDLENYIKSLDRLVNKYPNSITAISSLYKLASVYQNILKNSDKALEIYKKITTDYPNEEVTKFAEFNLMNMYISNGDMDKAKEEFENIKKKYPKDEAINASALFSVAKGYEKIGNWDVAIQIYNQLENDYPSTLEALRVPLEILLHYHKIKDKENIEKFSKQSIERYENIIKKNPGTKLSLIARNFLADVYILISNWEQAIKLLSELTQKYPFEPEAPIALFKLATIYEKELKDYQKAYEIYLKFMRMYPNYGFSGIIKDKIQQLSKYQKK